jgi:EAL and modified HD-GYP domain-containing signal transduction protein
MSEVVERLPLEDTISRALVSREGDLGRLIDTVAAYEVADLDALAASPIELSDLAPAYLNAIAWSMSVTAEAVSA